MYSTGTKLQGTTLALKGSYFVENGMCSIAAGLATYSGLFNGMAVHYGSFRVTGIIAKTNVDGSLCVPGKGTYLLDADAVKPTKIKFDGELITNLTIQQTTGWYDESAQIVSAGYNPKVFVTSGAANVGEVLITFYPKIAQ